ncbi:MAG TPA: sulfotransferase [Caulobacteraceae bacterium]
MPVDPPADDPRAALAEAARLLAAGRSREAAPRLEKALAADPASGAAWRMLGDIRLVAGDVAGAERAYDRMLWAVVPEAQLRAAALDLAEGRLAAARDALRAVLQRQPANLAAAHLMGEVLAREGDLAAAEPLLAQVVAAAPSLHLARLAHALALQRLGKPSEALAALAPLLAREPRHQRARLLQAALATELGDYAAAAEATAAVLADIPDQPHGWLTHGHGLRTLGRTGEAVAAWRRALALDPACAEAWWSLANLKAWRFSEADLAAMEALAAAPELPPERRSLVDFARAKAHEDAGRPADAFAAYARANAAQRALRAYDADRTTALVRRAQALLTPAFFAERAGWGEPAADPIFIVGLPRSGSTLVEQILASHPAVEATRELPDVQQMADWIAGQAPAGYPDALAALPAAAVRRLGRDYLARTRPQRRLGRPRFIDKAPWNWTHVGLIRLMLPNARIVDVRRHPLATCVSAFRQHFAGGFDFAFDLADLGRYYADYAALMAHHDAVLPGHVHRVIYEDLVADTEAEVRRLLAYLGLPFDAATLRFFETERPVATPSSEQVRQPIYADALDQWRQYEPWLGPLKDALGTVTDDWRGRPSPLAGEGNYGSYP